MNAPGHRRREGPAWTLHHGDCLDPVSGLASLPDRSVDHVITDPPYEAEAHTKGRRIKGRSIGGGAHKMVAAPLDFAPISEDARTLSAAHFARIARRWIIVFCQSEAAHRWASALSAGGADYVRTGVWIKPDAQPQLTGDRPGVGYETLVIAHAKRDAGRMRWNGGGGVAVWRYNKSGPAANIHSTQKPIDLMLALVRDFTDPGETILDPFAGSGTTGAACIQLGRSFIGWERDANYHAVASKRLAGVREQPSLFGERPKRAKTIDLFGTKAADGTDGAAVKGES